jgi:outer membrane protein assembly factor BamA
VAFTEPYLFERPLTVGTDIYARQFVYPNQYTQDTVGGNFMFGFPLADYTRAYLAYSYAQISVIDVNPVYLTLAAPGTGNFFLRESLLLDLGGRRIVSKVTPSVVHNTINRPIFPTDGRRITGSVDIAGLGGNTFYVQTRGEVMQFKPFTPKLAGAVRFEAQYVTPYGDTTFLPIFERIFLGGEYSVRGFDIRTIGPRDETGRAVIGGNKSLLFNAEFYFDPGGPIRLLAFYDAGQVRDVGESFVWFEEVTQLVLPDPPLLTDPFRFSNLIDPNNPPEDPRTEVIGRRNAFKTSTGVELRFFMPVLNVPFRLIAAYNPQRGGVLNNNFQLTPKFTFRFAVGTTF